MKEEMSKSKVASNQDKREETFVREKNNDFRGQQQIVDRTSGHSAALIQHMKLMDNHIKLVTEGHINNALKEHE